MWSTRAKRLVRETIGLPGVSDGLRWFLHQQTVPPKLRTLAHRKLAKLALFGSRTFTHRADSRTVLELVHTGTANYLYWLGAYEPESLAVFSSFARTSSVIFDIGACDGLYAIFAAMANPSAAVHAFEPFETTANITERNLALNASLTKHVTLHRCALGSEDGNATLYVASETGGNSSLNPAFRSEHTEQPTMVRRGDTFMDQAGLDRVDLLKIDTESTEPAVLRGFGRRLERHHPHILCEVLRGRTEQALTEILAPLGYRFWWITAAGLVHRDAIVGDNRFVNYLFTTDDENALAARGLTIAR